MFATILHDSKSYTVNLAEPLDISIPLTNSSKNPIAWYQEAPVIAPVKMGNWVGKVSEGKSSTNFNNIFFNPHAHGTHTECLGHITVNFYSINQCLKHFFFIAELISVQPILEGNDLIIKKQQLQELLLEKRPKAIIIRTLPNNMEKKNKNYSNTNPPYLDQDAANYLKEIGIEHLLIDLPSVDKEKDEGKLVSHKAFWNVTNIHALNPDARLHCTITEMIFVPNYILDGTFLLNIQIASFENDASPSKPVLYQILKA